MKALNAFAASAIVALGIFFLTACGPDPTGNGDGGNDLDGSCISNCTNPDGGKTDGGGISATVTITPPIGIVPEAYLIGNGVLASCAGKASCVAEKAPGTYTVTMTKTDLLFGLKPVTMTAGVPAQLAFNSAGDWGPCISCVDVPGHLKEEGEEYYYEDNPSEVRRVQTARAEDGHVVLLGFIGIGIPGGGWPLNGYAFEGHGEPGSGGSSQGTVASDLSTIQYHVTRDDGSEYDRTCIRAFPP